MNEPTTLPDGLMAEVADLMVAALNLDIAAG